MPGSLIKKGEGKWELRVSLGYDKATKKQIRKTKLVHCAKEKEAQKLLAEFYLEVTNNVPTNQRVRFSDFIEYYNKRHETGLSITTQIAHDKYLRLRILPAFGNRYLEDIKPADITEFLNAFSNPHIRLSEMGGNAGPLKTNTVRGYAKFLHSLFSKAVKWGFIKTNPFEGVDYREIKSMTGKPGHYPIWEKKDLLKFIDILDKMPERFFTLKNKLIFYLILSTGLRRGEVYGLTWNKINFEDKSILVDQAMKLINFGKPYELGKPKTSSSIRTVFFDDKTLNLLLKYMAALEKHLTKRSLNNTHNYVFIALEGSDNNEALPANGNTFTNWIKVQAKRYGLPPISMHSVRAMCATYSLLAGMPISLVRSMLGHSSINTTNIYTRDVLEERKEYSNIINNVIINPNKPDSD